MLEIIFCWIVLTLGLGALTGVLAKRYGVEIAIATFATLVVAANITAIKTVNIGPFLVPAAVIAYSTSFLVTDIITEKWGKEEARKAVWAGFWANIVLVISVMIVVSWPTASQSPVNHEAFRNVLGPLPRVVLASMIAYLVSQHHDVWAFSWWKKRTKGKYLWLRNNASTMISQFIDSSLFILIAFYGLMPAGVLLTMMASHWIIKWIIALIDTPFCYISCKLIDMVK